MNVIDALRMRYPAMQTSDIPIQGQAIGNATLPGASLVDRLRLGKMGYDELSGIDFDTLRSIRYAEQQGANGMNPVVASPAAPVRITPSVPVQNARSYPDGMRSASPAVSALAGRFKTPLGAGYRGVQPQAGNGGGGNQWGRQAAGGAAGAMAGRLGRTASMV